MVLRGLRIVERQMIAMVNCYIDVHHLKYGMTATKGHAVSFPSGMDIMRSLASTSTGLRCGHLPQEVV